MRCVRTIVRRTLLFCALASAAPALAQDAAAEERLEAEAPATEAAVTEAALSAEALTPHFADGVLAKARRALSAGAPLSARALLAPVSPTPPVRYLRALAALRGADFAAAAQEFEALAPDYPALRDLCLVQAGWAFERLRDWRSALRVFDAVSEGSRLRADARLGAARALGALERFDEADVVLSPLLDLPPPRWGRDVGAEAWALAAELRARAGQAAAARDALVMLLSRHPVSRAANSTARAAALGRLSPAETVRRAEALVEAGRYAQGLAAVEPLLRESRPGSAVSAVGAVACPARLVAGVALRRLRSHQRATQVLAEAHEWCVELELRARALSMLGQSQAVLGRPEALSTFERVGAEAPEAAEADDALLFAAQVLERRGEGDAAVDRLRALVAAYPARETVPEARLRLFWLERERAPEQALEHLLALEAWPHTGPTAVEADRLGYWLGRAFDALGRRAEALERWERVALAHPATYYGLLARERVEALDAQRGEALLAAIRPPVEAHGPFPLPLGPLAADPNFQSAVELLRLGFPELVPAELLAVNRRRLPAESLRTLVHLFAAVREPRAAAAVARVILQGELRGPITEENRATFELAYPRAFRELVEEHARGADGLEVDLLQGLVREESAMDPAARSPVGALGLCQLMPPTAAEVAAKLRLPRPSAAALTEPGLSLRLGARYLADLLGRAKGEKAYALAAYNAGEGSVGRWRRLRPDAPVDVWVEQIPYEETRSYVKRVLQSYSTYTLLYTPRLAPRSLSEPLRPVSAKAGRSRSRG